MKITNGSPALVHKGDISITASDIKIGTDVRAMLGALIFIAGVIAGVFLPGTWWYYWIAGFAFALVPIITIDDCRPFYTSDQISQVQILGVDRVGTKDLGGSLLGAAAGGILFGGFGAVVGAVAVGGKVDEFTNVAIKFTDGEWLIVTGEKGFVNSAEHFLLLKLAGNNNVCPI